MLTEKKISFTERLMDEDDTALELAKKLGYLQAPVVVTDEEHWSGFRPDKISALAARL